MMSSLHTPLCDQLGIKYPILQAGMGKSKGSPTTPELVAHVSEAGGLGFLGAAGLEPDELRSGIRKIRQLTSRPFGVGLLFPASLATSEPTRAEVRSQIERDFPEQWAFVQDLMKNYGLSYLQMEKEHVISAELSQAQLNVVIEESVPILAAGLGDPSWATERAHKVDMKVLGLAGTVRNAQRQRDCGVDIIIAQGYEAGGHTGTIANFALIPQVVDAVRPVPVLAAGGIADGRGVAAALALGAVGVWCGTAFLYAEEINLYDEQRRQLNAVTSEQLVLSRSYTGKPARYVKNEIMEAWMRSDLEPLPMPLQTVLMDDFVASAESAGRYDLVSNAAGQIAGMLKEVRPAADILTQMAEEAAEVIGNLSSRCLVTAVG